MMFARAVGPADKLNEFNLSIITADFYHPEKADEYMSGAGGYRSAWRACPYDLPIKHIEEIADMCGIDFSDNLTNVLGTGKTPSPSYIKRLGKYLSDADFDSSDIHSVIAQMEPKAGLDTKQRLALIDREKELTQKIDKLSHFEELDVDLGEMLGANYVEVHFGSLPKDSMIKLYMYNNEGKFTFKTLSSDKKYFWGVYCTSARYAKESSEIMKALYFDELVLDPGEGTVGEVIEKCKKELDEIRKEREDLSKTLEDNKKELANIYSILLDLRKLWDFRKYSVINDDSFCSIGWIPKKKESEARNLLGALDEVEYTIKDPEKSVTASGINDASPFETPIRDIEHLAHLVKFDLSPSKLHNVIGSGRPLTDEYITELTRYLGGADLKSGDVNSRLNAEIHRCSVRRRELRTRKRYLTRKIARLKHFSSLDVDLSEINNISFTSVHFGRLSNRYVKKVQELSDEKNFAFNICSSDEKSSWCIYFVPNKFERDAEEFFDSIYFREYFIDDKKGAIPDIIDSCEKELSDIDKEKRKIAEFWNKNESEIVERYSILQDLQQLWNTRKYFIEKNDRYIYTGSATRAEKRKMTTIYEAIGGFTDDGQESDGEKESLTPPTRLKNPAIVRPYEYYVKMYGTPGYDSIDITGFVAATYTVLFGIMFGDLGQGFVLSIVGILAWKLKKMELGKILVPCGISSMVFGLVFGSFFGYEDVLDPLYTAIGLKGKPLSVMDSINTVLLLAISIGISLVCVSILINIYANVKSKKFGEALFDNNGLCGLLFYICGVNLVYNFMAGKMIIPGVVCAIVAPVCAVALFLKEILIGVVDKRDDYKPESIPDFIMQNIFEMLEYVLSYFSNTVSFLRVGAFVLVHAGMMMVVFSLAGENRNILVIILGNILVICLEGLLTGIQALRLEFYEMFSRCFPGDGKEFISAKKRLDGGI